MPFPENRFLGKIARLLRFLERPPAHLTEETDRKDSRLLSKTQLAIIVLGLFMIPTADSFSSPAVFFRQWDNLGAIAGIGAMLACYLLNRVFGRCQTAALLTAALFSGFVLVLTPVLSDGSYLWSLFYLVVPVFICALFVDIRWTAFLIVAQLLGVCAMPFVVPGVAPESLPVAFIGLISVLILIMVGHIRELERIRADELSGNRELYRGMLETLFDAVALVKEGNVVQANPGFVRLFGFDAQHSAAIPIAGYIPAWQSVRPGQVLETAATGPQGVELNIELLCNRIKGDDSGTFILAVRDVSERKHAGMERERLVAAIEQSGESVVITGADAAILYVNPAYESVAGYTRDQVIGRNPGILKSGEHDAAFYGKMWDTLLQGRTWTGRIINKTKDGRRFVQETSISPVCDLDGHIVNYVSVAHDITEQLSMQDENRRLEEQLVQSQRMESIGRFAGGVAHDLNNILAIILGYGELAASEIPAGSPLAEPIREINAAGDRARELTRHLLAFSRRQVLEMRPLDLNTVVAGFEKMLRRLLSEDIEMKVQFSPLRRFVKADTTQIEQVLMNLCINARDAMPKGGVLTIDVGQTALAGNSIPPGTDLAPGNYATLTVADTGCGMDKATRLRIFEPFFTTKEKEKGTGLGLSTVFGIVKQHDGDVIVRSSPGRGAVFTVYLPTLPSAADSTPAPEKEDAPRGNGETVLVLEDDPSVRRLACRMLVELGYRPIETATPEECIAAAGGADRIDLLLTDIIMPDMDGCEVHEKVTAVRPGIKTLFVSGYTDDILVRHGFTDMAGQFLAKPFTQSALAKKLRQVLGADTAQSPASAQDGAVMD